MSDKTTLRSYTTPNIPVEEISRSETDVPESFYDELVTECEKLAVALVENFPTRHTNAGYIIEFSDASTEEYETAIEAQPKIVIQGLVAACHMSERIVREHTDVGGVYGYGYEGVSVADTPQLQKFISDCCQQYLSHDVPVETVLHLYFRLQEQHRAPQAGKSFHETVREYLANAELCVQHGGNNPGRPNFLVNKTEPIEFTGNAVAGKAINPKATNVPKRARQVASRLETMKDGESQITTAMVLDIENEEFANERVRENQREVIKAQNPDAIDGIFFSDELRELVGFCNDNIEVFNTSPRSPNEEVTTNKSLESWKR